jgi:hypothetical protein
MPFSSLIEPDLRVMHATLVPPGTSEVERAEIAAEKLCRMVKHSEISSKVPEILRKNFERLRTIHVYGLLCYDLFTQVDDQALLLTEQALRTRFIDLYDHRVPFEKNGAEQFVEAAWYDDVYRAVHSSDLRGWRLRLRDGRTILFNGSMDHLYRWARQEGLLGGQRNRHYEQLTIKQRNRVAHPESYHLTWEVDSARAIFELAELINRLWGEPGRGGRYSATAHREVLAFGWKGEEWPSLGRAIGLPNWGFDEDHKVVLVLGVWDDTSLGELDTAFDLSTYPTEQLFGPVSPMEATAWLEANQPKDDEAAFHDRLFLVRSYKGRVEPPRRPERAAKLNEEERRGEWLVVRADFPSDAWVHARNRFEGLGTCARLGPCEACPAETIERAGFRRAFESVTKIVGPIEPDPRERVRVPGPRSTWGVIAEV